MPRQSSWAAGELTPDLHGQAGTAAYRAGAALIKNFVVTPQGPVINRSGSVHMATLGAQTSRLVPFIFAGDEPRLVQLYGYGAMAMRKPDGGFAEVGANDTSNDSIVPSRAAVLETLRRIRTAQCAGTMMYSVEASSESILLWVAEIRRNSATDYAWPKLADTSPPAFGSSANPFVTTNSKRTPAVETSATGLTLYPMAGDATHPKREWDYCVTRVVSIEDGNPDKPNQVIETSPRGLTVTTSGDSQLRDPGRITFTVDSAGAYTAANVPAEIAVYGDWSQRIEVSGAAGDPWAESGAGGARTGTIIAHRVYRGRHGVFGYIGETTTRHFVDDGRDPDIANPPPLGGNPFWIDGAFLTPTALAFLNDRRFLANIAPAIPQRIAGSAVGNWSDFQEVVTPDDEDALVFDLASNKHEEVRHLFAGQVLIAFTEKTTWAIVGSGNLEVLTPTAIVARKVLSVGSAHYPAPTEGDSGVDGESSAIFFIEAKGGHPYAVTVDGNGAAQLTDLSLLSAHYFEGHTIVDLAWARDPHQTLWAVRDDGILLSLTFAPGLGTRAWAQHGITGGVVEAVATLPIGHEDLLYMVVKRGSALNIERLATRLVSDPRYECHLDCATISDLTKAFSLTVTGVAGGGAVLYTLTITMGLTSGLAPGDRIIFPDVNGYMVQATVDTVVGTAVGATVTDYSGDVLQVSPGHSVAAGLWGLYDDSVTVNGLSNGTVVTAVIDGAVVTDLVVGADTTGKVTLPVAGLVRIVGLPFKSQLQSLAVEQERGKQKAVADVLVELGRSRGGAVGTDFEHLVEIPPRNVEDGYGVIAPRKETVIVPVPSEFDKTAQVVIEQSQPRSIKISALQWEYTLGG